MTTWSELVNFVKTNSDGFAVLDSGLIKAEISLPGGRSQLVFVFAPEPLGDTHLVKFASPVGEKQKVNPDNLLNFPAPFGFAALGDYYQMVHTVVLETLDTAEAMAALLGLAVCADQAEKKLTGGDRF